MGCTLHQVKQVLLFRKYWEGFIHFVYVQANLCGVIYVYWVLVMDPMTQLRACLQVAHTVCRVDGLFSSYHSG